jgi:hypothetical protein
MVGTQSRSSAQLSNIGACAGMLLGASSALAQPVTPPAPAAAPPGNPSAPVSLESLPPPLRLGARVNLAERQFTIIPTLVLVPDEASYIAAIEAWNTNSRATRFPVLIDDGTWACRMRVARFVRAFTPASVVRWQAGAALSKLPDGADARQKRIENAAASAWGVQAATDLAKRWEALHFKPPGVVVCSTKDPAWTAGVALAAFHGQPMLWMDPPNCPDPTGYLMLDQADDLNARIIKGLEKLGRPWNRLGDEIDAVTLCMTTPSRAWLGKDDKRRYLAVTDIVGRSDDKSGRARWAWCGQIMGDGERAAYDAMCALFLRPEGAWLFDGYDTSTPWNRFDMTAAAASLQRAGIVPVLDDNAAGCGLVQWRLRCGGTRQAPGSPPGAGMGIDAGLVAVNSSGNGDYFDLKPGQGKPGDAPILRRPAMVYFVHSFSLVQPTNRSTVGGAWLDRGAFAYVGSVEEPFLEAFVPTPKAMARLAEGVPWGAAMRTDDGVAWKLAVLGDPLITLGPQGTRDEKAPLPLNAPEDLNSMLPEQLRQRDVKSAMWTLVLLGRDADATRLLSAALKDESGACTPDVALVGLQSAFFTGDYKTFLSAASRAVPAMSDPARVTREGLAEVRDTVWQAVWRSLPRATDEEFRLLHAYARPDMAARDASEIH